MLQPNAASIDVGAREVFVAVPPARDNPPVRVFATFTEDLQRLVDWLVHCGVTTVALESTGVYWIPLYELLEQRGIRPCLVNARHMKNVPGRRTDWHECQWLQFLHSVGLLRSAFRPEQNICAVRTLLRHRSELVMAASQHVQHMHKALTQMNLQIHHVIGDITGVTGLAIVDAILAGQRDATELAKLRDPHIKAADEVSSPGESPGRPGEFRPEPPTDPDVNLSIHPARATQRRLPPSIKTRSSSGYPLTPSRRGWPAPFAPRELPRFLATTKQCAPDRCIGTFGLVGSPLVPFPFASPTRFSSSVRKPG